MAVVLLNHIVWQPHGITETGPSIIYFKRINNYKGTKPLYCPYLLQMLLQQTPTTRPGPSWLYFFLGTRLCYTLYNDDETFLIIFYITEVLFLESPKRKL